MLVRLGLTNPNSVDMTYTKPAHTANRIWLPVLAMPQLLVHERLSTSDIGACTVYQRGYVQIAKQRCDWGLWVPPQASWR